MRAPVQGYGSGGCEVGLTRKTPTPYDHHRTLGIGLLKSHAGGRFFLSEVTLYSSGGCEAGLSRKCAQWVWSPHPGMKPGFMRKS